MAMLAFFWNSEIDLYGTKNLLDSTKHCVIFQRDTENVKTSIYVDGELDANVNSVGSDSDSERMDSSFLFSRDYRSPPRPFNADVLRINAYSTWFNQDEIFNISQSWLNEGEASQPTNQTINNHTPTIYITTNPTIETTNPTIHPTVNPTNATYNPTPLPTPFPTPLPTYYSKETYWKQLAPFPTPTNKNCNQYYSTYHHAVYFNSTLYILHSNYCVTYTPFILRKLNWNAVKISDKYALNWTTVHDPEHFLNVRGTNIWWLSEQEFGVEYQGITQINNVIYSMPPNNGPAPPLDIFDLSTMSIIDPSCYDSTMYLLTE
eukprot:517926_1